MSTAARDTAIAWNAWLLNHAVTLTSKKKRNNVNKLDKQQTVLHAPEIYWAKAHGFFFLEQSPNQGLNSNSRFRGDLSWTKCGFQSTSKTVAPLNLCKAANNFLIFKGCKSHIVNPTNSPALCSEKVVFFSLAKWQPVIFKMYVRSLHPIWRQYEDTRNSHLLNSPLFRTASVRRTFQYRVVFLWNDLQPELKTDKSVTV